MSRTVFWVGLVSLLLAGCATGRRSELEKQALKNQINLLQTQLQQKDEQISALQESLQNMQTNNTSVSHSKKTSDAFSSVSSTRVRPTIKQIQQALKNVGYYKGEIDGKMGKATRAAIRKFQRDNGLPADGIVGKRTWKKLRKHLES